MEIKFKSLPTNPNSRTLWNLDNRRTTWCHLLFLFHFLCAQHVSDFNISIIRSLWLFCWIFFSLQHIYHSKTTTSKHQHTSKQEHTTNVVIQQNSRKLLMMDIFMSETFWAHKKWNKNSKRHQVGLLFSTITMVPVPINIRFIYQFNDKLNRIYLLFWQVFFCGTTAQIELGSHEFKFLDFTHLTHTSGRTAVNKWSARLRGRYLHNTSQTEGRTSLSLEGLEPGILVIRGPKSFALDRTNTGVDFCSFYFQLLAKQWTFYLAIQYFIWIELNIGLAKTKTIQKKDTTDSLNIF